MMSRTKREKSAGSTAIWLLICLFVSVVMYGCTPTASGIDNPSVSGITRADAVRAVTENVEHSGVLVVAHRGSHADSPENSLGSIVRAAEIVAHIVEIDVRTTQDGAAVLMHDRTIDRTTTGKGVVSEMTLKELEGVHLLKGVYPTPEAIPTLHGAFDAARGRVVLNIDPKDISIREAVDLARAAGVLDHCLFKLGWNKIDHAMLEWLDANPDVYFMPICRGQDQVDAALEAREWPAVEILIASPEDPLWSTETLEALRLRGVRPWVNTLWNGRLSAGVGDYQAVQDPAAVLGPVLEMGWGFVQTDLPGVVVEITREMGRDPLAATVPE